MPRTRSQAADRRVAVGLSVALVCSLLSALESRAMCDVIPGVTQEFRGALGRLDRPFALPNDQGEILRVSLARDADEARSQLGCANEAGRMRR